MSFEVVAAAEQPAVAVEEAASPVAVAVAEPVPQQESFLLEDHQDENGESLDIPAYLRRGGL
jgi:hypothetical protein